MRKFFQITTAEAGLLQAQAYRALRKFMTAQLHRHQLSMPQWSLLGRLLEQAAGLRVSGVATLLNIDLPFATHLIKDLESRGLLTKQTDPNDKRVKLVILTTKGKQLVPKIERDLHQAMDRFLPDVPRSDLAKYLSVLEQIAAKA